MQAATFNSPDLMVIVRNCQSGIGRDSKDSSELSAIREDVGLTVRRWAARPPCRSTNVSQWRRADKVSSDYFVDNFLDEARWAQVETQTFRDARGLAEPPSVMC
jgi:hypothetical protein